IKTGLQGFAYDIRTALLPFLFIFNTELLLIDVGLGKAIFVFVVATIAMMLFASATQSWFLTRNKIWESAILLLVAFTLFRPGFWLDRWQPEFEIIAPANIMEVVGKVPADGIMTIVVSGPNFDTGKTDSTTLLVPLGASSDDPAKRLKDAGLVVALEDGKAKVEEPLPQTPFFEKIGKSFDFYGDEPVVISEIKKETERMFKEVFYIPALLLLGLVVLLQLRRRRKGEAAAAAAA
ncbi:MAG: DUF3394 domain-containing protein, partial [Rhizobiales bacterium]|nr:DUF3394 domain-containing protein [Hyphomicrobiales bacterium]